MLTLKLQAEDYELALLTHKLKSYPFLKQSQDQSLFQAEHFRPKSCLEFCQKLLKIVKNLNFAILKKVFLNFVGPPRLNQESSGTLFFFLLLDHNGSLEK